MCIFFTLSQVWDDDEEVVAMSEVFQLEIGGVLVPAVCHASLAERDSVFDDGVGGFL